PLEYSFTERERRALRPFFSNVDRKVFFMSGLPESVAATLLAMYSRLKNPRGLRGHFVDNMLPVLMFANAMDVAGLDTSASWETLQKMFRAKRLTALDAICEYDRAYQELFEDFVRKAADADYWRAIAESDRITDFKNRFLDQYGHNSIARPTMLRLCAEDVSILFAKTVEWTWPGTGFIELSTRYVDFSGKTQLPIGNILGLLDGTIARMADECIETSVAEYRRLIGNQFDGPFPEFLRRLYRTSVPNDADLRAGVIGESCDVLGNLLPCATLTQLGIGVSGEAMGSLIKNLYLDGTPENIALAEFIVAEAERAGHSYFLRHYQPTPWEERTWEYLTPLGAPRFEADPVSVVDRRIALAANARTMGEYIDKLSKLPRSDHDQLPDEFRLATIITQAHMSFRGWRDAQRQSLSVHKRSRVTPLAGFYRYPKPAPPELHRVFEQILSINEDLYMAMCAAKVPEELMEYPMAMGNLVRYQMTSTLKQAEYCNWQRTKWGVNDEVRQQFLAVEDHLRQEYSWWGSLSRADRIPHYVFARGKEPIALDL
ncbi:MAG TPA: hypothetical protein VJ553_04690, partial [Candidatus Paceibacterota bacterium]|nr:hypothetical protein [Candidatus Paceibacterota bacterium]